MAVATVAAAWLSAAPASAQLTGAGDPTNLSVSGSASQPVIGVAPNGNMSVLWWDEIDGTRFARGVISDTGAITWNKSVVVPSMVGERKSDPNTNVTSIRSPRRIQMLVDGKGVAHATWFDVEDKLLYSSLNGANWTAPVSLAPRAAAVAMSLDISGTLQMAYVQNSNSAQSPAGMYYLYRTGNTFKRTLVYASTYFRTAEPADISLSVARDNANHVLVAWHAAREEQSVQALSNDGGAKWELPQPIAPRNQVFGLPVKVSVAATGPGQFLALWRDAGAPGCGMTQKRSTDAGASWSAPERVMANLVRCPGNWTFVNGDNGALILVGKANLETGGSDTAGTLAVWDGAAWAQPLDVEVPYKDPVTNNTRTLGCVSMALQAGNLAIVGCDARSDVWAKGQKLQADSLLQTSKSPWGRQTRLAGLNATGATNGVSIAADQKSGTTYAVWSQALTPGTVGKALNIALLRSGQWSEPVELLRAEQDFEVSAESALAQTDQPSIAVDANGKVHVVWSGGPSGRVFYTSAFAPDVLVRSRWTAPTPLPAPSLTNSDPSVATDASGQTVLALYAVPFNEKRGVYLTRSNDAGRTWLTQTLVFDAQAAGWDAVDSTRLVIDSQSGVLHAAFVKAQVPGATGPRAVYYSRSTDNGQTWSTPQLADEGDIGTPRIQVYDKDKVLMAWTKKNPNPLAPQAPWQVWWQVSPEDGQRWTRPALAAGFEGVSGAIGLTTNGAGALHLAALGRGASDETTVLYAQWDGAGWSPVEATSLGEPSALGNGVDMVYDAAGSSLVAALHTAILQPDGSRPFGPIGLARNTSSTGTIVPTPAPLPTFTPAPMTSAATASVLPTETPLPQIDLSGSNTPNAQTGVQTNAPTNTLLISGIIAAAVVIVGSIVASILIRRR